MGLGSGPVLCKTVTCVLLYTSEHLQELLLLSGPISKTILGSWQGRGHINTSIGCQAASRAHGSHQGTSDPAGTVTGSCYVFGFLCLILLARPATALLAHHHAHLDHHPQVAAGSRSWCPADSTHQPSLSWEGISKNTIWSHAGHQLVHQICSVERNCLLSCQNPQHRLISLHLKSSLWP